jgi:G3E family GTPase
MPQSARYIIRKQLEEADIIVLNKVDQFPASELHKLQDEMQNQFPNTAMLSMSALESQSGEAPTGSPVRDSG